MKKIFSIILLVLVSTKIIFAADVSRDEPTDRLTLITDDGQIITTSRNIVKYMPTINNMIEDIGGEVTEIPVANVNIDSLKVIVDAIKEIKLQFEEFKQRYPEFFEVHGLEAIPGHIQSIVDNLLKNKGDQDLVDFMNDANYLGIDLLVNAASNFWIRKNKTISHASSLGLYKDIATHYLLKQITKNYPELSIADLILDNKLPEIKNNELDLSFKNITSLAGLSLIDPDKASKITRLIFYANQLTTIEDNVFSNFKNLESLNLALNQLITIEDKAFFNLHNKLRELYLHKNPLLDKSTKMRIRRQFFPNIRIEF